MLKVFAWIILAAAVLATPVSAAPPTLEQILAYPFVSSLVSASGGGRIAWVENVNGVRNIWSAAAPQFAAFQLTHYTADDGQELTQLHFDRAGNTLIYVRGGDHDANWEAEGNLAPDPSADPVQQRVEIWAVPVASGTPTLLAEGDEPAISSTGQVGYVNKDQIWTVPLNASAKPRQLLFDRGKDRAPLWSPDGTKLAFVTARGDHAFIAVYSRSNAPVIYLAPSTGRDGDLVWSPDGRRIAFTRQPGDGGAPRSLLKIMPQPFAIWTADTMTGVGHNAWSSPITLDGSYSHAGDGVGLRWMANDTLTFLTTLDGWQHLYTLPAAGGTPKLLTPGKFMVEHVSPTPDSSALYYAANTGRSAGDDDRRHAFRVALDGGAPTQISEGNGLEWSPVPAGRSVALVTADATRPASVVLMTGNALKTIHNAAPNYPAASLVTPKLVSFIAPDGLTIQGQLFEAQNTKAKHPAIVFVHGGPLRQMLLGWHYMEYYSNAYALNQYLASRGFTVLSVNYRLGIGYGRAFQQPDRAGAKGGSEYQDVLASAKYLQTVPGVDAARIGIWGGSYGGYLTGMALSRNSDIFKVGVDMHGIHDWSMQLAETIGPQKRYEQGDWDTALKTAFDASPDAQIANWRSPVLLIQGDDDRNVRFNQTVDAARRLTELGVDFKEMVIPDEIHGFLRHDSWHKADEATAQFLTEKLGSNGP
jgi:dipeptidyl aminopeptidase/acylaminoacyl peptidase